MKWSEIPLVCDGCRKRMYRPFFSVRPCAWCGGSLRCELAP